MQDRTNLHAPAVLTEIAAEAAAIDFTISSDALTGSLLRTLAASKPAGKLLELGTGAGMGTAWLLAGMAATATLITVDHNSRTGIARRLLGHDARVTFQSADGADFIRSCLEQGQRFDLIFADMPPGKFSLVDETLSLLNRGGFYIVDDLLPKPSWPADHQARKDQLITTLDSRSDLSITKLNWSVGLIVATKV